MKRSEFVTRDNLSQAIRSVIWDPKLKLPDVHTHLMPPEAGEMWFSGIIKLLMYHYAYREHLGWRIDVPPATFWAMDPRKAADQVWNTHFVRNRKRKIGVLPVSEGMRAVLTILKAFDLDVNALTIDDAVDFFSQQDPTEHTNRVLEIAGISNVVGTNNPFDRTELAFYRSGKQWHPAFSAALRLDDLVLNPKWAFEYLRTERGYSNAHLDFSASSIKAARKFVADWLKGSLLPRVNYVGISFPPDFPWNDISDPRVRVLEEVVFPACAEKGVSLFLMPEPVRQLEPLMKNAGDFLGKMDCVAFGRFAQRHSEVDLWVSPLNYASQYEMSALCCNLPHVKPWSTWWYNHQPSLTQALTNMRMEMHGSNSLFFNSDARVLEHLISKWHHFKQELQLILENQLGRLLDTGYKLSVGDIHIWVKTLFDERRLNRKKWQRVLTTSCA